MSIQIRNKTVITAGALVVSLPNLQSSFSTSRVKHYPEFHVYNPHTFQAYLRRDFFYFITIEKRLGCV